MFGKFAEELCLDGHDHQTNALRLLLSRVAYGTSVAVAMRVLVLTATGGPSCGPNPSCHGPFLRTNAAAPSTLQLIEILKTHQ